MSGETAVIYDLDPDPRVQERFGAPLSDPAIDIGWWQRPRRVHDDLFRQHHARLRSVGGALSSTPVIWRQAARGGDLVVGWIALEMLWEAPAGTTGRARRHDGAGTDLWWDGAAWTPAGPADWNAPEEISQQISALTAATAQRVGLVWELGTTTNDATPIVLGGVLMAAVRFGAINGEDEVETRSDGWLDDLIHRTMLPWLRAAQPTLTDEFVVPSDRSVLDYSSGVGETPLVVSGVHGVFDVGADPRMLSQLPGTWDAAHRRFLLAAPVTAGTRLAVRLVYTPVTAYTGNLDLFDAGRPQIVIEQVARVRGVPGLDWSIVRTNGAPTAARVAAPTLVDYRVVVLLQGLDAITTFDLAAALQQRLGGRRGTTLISSGTGALAHVRSDLTLRPARMTSTKADAARFDLAVRSLEYHGAADTVRVAGSVRTTIEER